MRHNTIFESPANLLMPLPKLALNGMGRQRRADLSLAVAVTGNWVGGRLWLSEREIRFQVNALNRRFQADTAPVAIPLADIASLSRGRLLWFFPTADVTTAAGTYRFRLSPRRTDPFLALLQRHLPSQPA